MLGSLCGAVLLTDDRVGLVVAFGVGLFAGLTDALWTLVRLGRNRIRIGPDEVLFLSGTSKRTVIPIEPGTAFTIEVGATSWLEYFSAAYTTFTTVGLTTTKSRIELLAKTPRQVEQLQSALDRGLEAARSGGAVGPD